MATSKRKPAKKSVKKEPDAPTAPEERIEPPTKEVVASAPSKVYTIELVEGASLTRKGLNFVAGRPVPVDEATYRLFENNGRFRCLEREGGRR